LKHVELNGGEIEYQVQGSGDPLLLIHGGILADSNAPLCVEPAISDSYCVISYHRRGFANSARVSAPFTIGQHAADGRALLDHLEIPRAHILGHSYGAAVALQWALDSPAEVQSLALLEPPIPSVPSWPMFLEGVEAIRTEMYECGHRVAAVEAFLTAVVGPDFRQYLDKYLPSGAFDMAVSDLDALFQVEFPSLMGWRFTANEAGSIRQPVLAVVGSESTPMFQEGHTLLRQWIAHSEELIVPEANHGLPYVNPSDLAKGLARFFAAHKL